MEKLAHKHAWQLPPFQHSTDNLNPQTTRLKMPKGWETATFSIMCP